MMQRRRAIACRRPRNMEPGLSSDAYDIIKGSDLLSLVHEKFVSYISIITSHCHDRWIA